MPHHAGGIQPPINGGEVDRIAQAAAVNDFVDEILCREPGAKVVVLGDLNEFTPFPPLVVRHQEPTKCQHATLHFCDAALVTLAGRPSCLVHAQRCSC